jgi:prepilin-type N-terminal cleavage/methylation domain-containing protein
MALLDQLRGSNSPRNGLSVVRSQRGFSLLEMLITITIILILCGITFVTLQPGLQQSNVNTAYDTTLMTLRNYRSQAITQRKQYIVTFTTPTTITVSYQGVGVPVNPPPVVVQTVTLPANDTVQFAVQAGVPTTATTVPDGFGNGTVGIDLDYGPGGAGGGNYVKFMPDGSAQDTLGNLNSGVVYIGRPGQLNTMRAVTVVGATGRVRGWRLNVPTAGGPTWIQQ